MPSIIERSPRAPVLRAIAFCAIARKASSENSKLHVLHIKEPLILLDQRIARLGQNFNERILIEIRQRRQKPEDVRRIRG